jgi:hypothetical protein
MAKDSDNLCLDGFSIITLTRRSSLQNMQNNCARKLMFLERAKGQRYLSLGRRPR